MTADHLDDGVIQTLLHDEARDARGVAWRAHLDACAECRNRVEDARREEANLFKSFDVLDSVMPTIGLSDLSARATRRPGAMTRRGAWRWAAGILFAIGLSGVAYAAPGSPLRLAIDRLVAWIRPPSATTAPERLTPTPTTAGGVLMDPGDSVVIELRSMQPFDSLVVFLVDEPQVAVRAYGGEVTFASDVARLSVSNASGSARIEMAIPRTAPRVEIMSGGRSLFAKVGNVVNSVATDTTGGRYVVFPPRR